ncbi:hypothetical protein VE04_04399 [Pseudogymnoascus sp. 24MN13]|nr:hypothetical protein VE04_04399 [Pseudogymnoascus sp. 24MN13]
MVFAHWTLAVLLATSLTQASWIPTRNQQQHAERDVVISANTDTSVEVHLSDFATLEELAEELIIDFRCLLDANPLLSTLHPGDHCIVPYSCCGTSCKGKFCNERPECQGHSTSSHVPVVTTVHTTITKTTCVTSVTSSIPTTQSTSNDTTVVPPPSSSSLPSSSSATTPDSPTIPGIVTTTNSLGQTVISDSSGAVTLPTGISTASVITLPDGSVVTFQTSATAPGSSSPPTTIPGVVTTTNSLGQTVISDTSGAVTLPSDISTASVVTLPDSSVVTFQPTTEATGSSSLPGILTTTDTAGETVISSSGEQFTIPTAITTPITLTNGDGSIFTFLPTVSPPPDSSSQISSPGPPDAVTTTDPAGETVISSSGEEFTIPPAVTTPITVTNGDGSIFTFLPTVSPPPDSSSPVSSSPPDAITTTDPAGETVISSSGEEFTIPPAVTTPITVTNGDGSEFTFSPTASPSSSSTPSTTIPVGVIFPVTTTVDAPKATDGGTVIPCNLWFFNICIRFGKIDIGGWLFNLPEGIRPPGPPPGITFPPSLSISIGISGTLPPWPAITIGPDKLPTYEPKPSDGPDDGCKTESAEICLTSTSFEVDTATVTTASSVISTCVTVFGCDVTDSATSTAATSTASSSEYPYSCTPGCEACVAKRQVATATAAPSLPTTDTKKAKSLFSYAQNLTLAERDIPNRADADVISEYYDMINSVPGRVLITEDNMGQLGISSSRFEYFDNSEHTIYLRSLRGCTSVIVVSRLGVYLSHLWEPSFSLDVTADFQTGVIDYLNTGRQPDQTGGVTEDGVTEALGALVQGGVFGDVATTKIFIMTPATYDLDLDLEKTPNADQRASLNNGDFQPLFDGTTVVSGQTIPDRLTPLKAELGQLMPGVPISQFTYRRQTDDDRLKNDGYGKATVVYSNDQKIDPDTFEDIGPPQQAIWQCWIQGKMMDTDRWDALPGQTGSCSANQKRQNGGQCSSPTASSGASTSAPTNSPTTAPTLSTVIITPTGTDASSPPPTDLPTLTTAQSTPAGETCVSTATSTQCALGPHADQTACVTNTYCASFAPTETTPTSTAEPTPTGQVYVDIFTDSDCINVLEQITLNFIGDCYTPKDKDGHPITFECFSLTYISPAAENSASLTAIKGAGCFSQFDSDRQVYPDLMAIQYDDEKPFTMGSISLDGK